MLAIILYYVNWIKWISNGNTFEKFISLDKPESESIIRFDSEQLSSLSTRTHSSGERSASKDADLFLDSNHSFKYSSHETINLPLSDSSFIKGKENESSNFKNKTNSNQINSKNKLNLNPTKATSLQSSNYTNHNLSNDLANGLQSDVNSESNKDLNGDLSDNSKQNDISNIDHSNLQILKDANQKNDQNLPNLVLAELDQQKQLKKSEINEFSVDSTIEQQSSNIHPANLHSIHVLSSKFKVELRIDNQMVCFLF